VATVGTDAICETVDRAEAKSPVTFVPVNRANHRPDIGSRIGITDEERVDIVEAMLKVDVPADQATGRSGNKRPATPLDASCNKGGSARARCRWRRPARLSRSGR
jgi:hypothetical protein